MTLTTPQWLARHDGTVRPMPEHDTWVVLVGHRPQYVLKPIPAKGQHACVVEQTVNGRRLESGAIYPTVEAALHGGLEDLRKALGW